MTKAIKTRRELEKYISQVEAARICSVSKQAIGSLVKRGKLTGYEVGGRTVLLRSEVEAYVPGPVGRPPKKSTPVKIVPVKTAKKKALPKRAAPPSQGA